MKKMYNDLVIDYLRIGVETSFIKNPPTGGIIKQEPEDFTVSEISRDYERKDEGKYTHCILEKKDWSTINAVKKIARACHISWKRISFAGTKDKNALTRQRISIKNVSIETLKKIRIKDINLSDFYYSDERINIGDLKGNSFVIRVRDYECKKVRRVLEDFINESGIKGIPNFFGEQRFGTRQNNHLIGKHILKEEYEKAMFELLTKTSVNETQEARDARNFLKNNWKDWKNALLKFPKYLRIELTLLEHLNKHSNDYVNAFRKLPRNLAKIFIYSYQSYLFNMTISELINNELLTSFELEIPGYNSELKSIGSSVMDEIMKKENVRAEDFKVSSYPEISCTGTKRKTVFFPKDFKIEEITNNDYVISFSAPSAVYATILLKEMIL